MTGSSAYHLCLLSIRLFPSVLSVLLHIYVFCQFDCFLQSYQSCCVCRSSVFCHLYHHSVSSFSLVATQDLHLCIICVFCLLSSVSSCIIIQSCCRSRSSSVYHLRLLSFVSSCKINVVLSVLLQIKVLLSALFRVLRRGQQRCHQRSVPRQMLLRLGHQQVP